MSNSNKFKTVELSLSAGGLLLALIVGIIGYMDYRDRAQLQAMRALHDAQLQLCQEVSIVSAKLTASTDLDALYLQLDSLSELKHGKALILLKQPVLDKLVDLFNSAVNFTNLEEIDDSFRDQLRCAVGQQALDVVLECRSMMAQAFDEEANFELDQIDTNYELSWGCDLQTQSNKKVLRRVAH